ncbi:sortase family protein [Coriobacterium glomerans PW2]|uniref:Sortase family protein n=1 Tax=Coriobacterium glomerans (strain ATCC 49209 / DSM 20642 / JCM 10262 / PW2) TaxID=700015 RepID=F2N7B2_CORGP|nr:class C sortase [Coriobacterium glomerans]AEB06587.1 sortase family protein [Coriobacterium glomerans PW2]
MAKRRKGRLFASIIAALVFFVGVGCILYPYVSDWYQKYLQSKVIRNQQEIIQEKDRSSLEDELQQCIDYNARLLDNRTVLTDPFDPNNQPVTAREYSERLNLAGDGVMGDIVIPKIKVKLPIYHSTTEDVLQRGAGHLEGTSLPVGGKSTHAVIAGHNGLPSVKIFDDIGKLKVGDYFVIQVLGEDHAYSVTSTEVVLPEETNSLVIEHGQDLVTLVTCTPYGVNTHRLLVHAKRTELPDTWLNRDSKNTDFIPTSPKDIPLWVYTIGGLGIAGLIFSIYLILKRRKRRKRMQAQAIDAAETAAQIANLTGIKSPPKPANARSAPQRLSRRELSALQEHARRRERASRRHRASRLDSSRAPGADFTGRLDAEAPGAVPVLSKSSVRPSHRAPAGSPAPAADVTASMAPKRKRKAAPLQSSSDLKGFNKLIEELAFEDARAEKTAKKKRKQDKVKKGSKAQKAAKREKESKSNRDSKRHHDSKRDRDAKADRTSKSGKSAKTKKGSKRKKRA